MSAIGSSNTSRSKKKEPRRVWTKEEEKALLEHMKGLVSDGWKSDNGFRANYQNRLEDAMNKQFPFSNFKAQPHISSKITAWKKIYGSLMSILSHSGVGFNVHGDNKIDCDDLYWEEITRTDLPTRSFKEKTWPLLEGWKVVFGKDRATGEVAKDIMENVNEMIAEHEVLKGAAKGKAKENFVDLEDNLEPQTEQYSVCESAKEDITTTSSSKKRKAKDSIDNLREVLSSIHKDTNKRLQELAHALSYHSDVEKQRKEVYSLLNDMENLTLGEKLRTCDKLIMQTERLHFFMSLPEMARATYVHQVLSNVD